MDTKFCKRCDSTLSVDKFTVASSRKDGLQVYCQECMKEYRKEHYNGNKSVYRDRARARERKMQRYVWLEKNKPCMDCGVQYLGWVMQFDHRPDENKVDNIGKIIKRGSWQKLKDEIAKCDVVCANCHIVRTATRAGWKLDAVVQI